MPYDNPPAGPQDYQSTTQYNPGPEPPYGELMPSSYDPPLPVRSWENMCNMDKFEHLKQRINNLELDQLQMYSRMGKLEQAFREHLHAQSGQIVVPYR